MSFHIEIERGRSATVGACHDASRTPSEKTSLPALNATLDRAHEKLDSASFRLLLEVLNALVVEQENCPSDAVVSFNLELSWSLSCFHESVASVVNDTYAVAEALGDAHPDQQGNILLAMQMFANDAVLLVTECNAFGAIAQLSHVR